MDFTELFAQSQGIVHFSPGRHFTLSAVQDRLVVRRIDKEGIFQSWLVDASPSATTAALAKGRIKPPQSDGWITHAAWSPDSEHILAAVAKRGVVNVYSMRDEKWNARIEAGAEGLTKAEWAPDSRSIICFSEWGLRVTIWSLSSGTATYIQYPKHTDRGYAFRKDGRYFVLAERHKSKDMMGVYECPIGYKLVRHFPLPTSSLASVALSPTGNHIAVWESVIEFKVVIMNLVGQHLATFVPEDNPLLGVRQIAWHPSGSFLAIGGWDSKIYILSSLEWKLVATLSLTSKLSTGTVLWREPPNWIANSHNRGFLPFNRATASPSTPFVINIAKPSTLAPTVMVANASPAPKSGVVSLQFSATGSTLLATWEQCPAYAFIYNFPSSLEETFQPRLRTVIQCNQSILQAQISNAPTLTGTTVAICSGTTAIYLWNNDRIINEEGERGELAECVGVPTNKKFSCRDIRWSPDGRGVILLDKETFCAAFEVEG